MDSHVWRLRVWCGGQSHRWGQGQCAGQHRVLDCLPGADGAQNPVPGPVISSLDMQLGLRRGKSALSNSSGQVESPFSTLCMN